MIERERERGVKGIGNSGTGGYPFEKLKEYLIHSGILLKSIKKVVWLHNRRTIYAVEFFLTLF